MKKSLIYLAMLSALPLMAQEAPVESPQCPQPPCPCKCRVNLERHAAFMEKFDVNKDGQLDDQEKEAVKAEFAKRHEKCGDRPRGPKGPGCKGRPHGPRHEKMMEKFDVNKDGQLDDQEKAAMKAEFAKCHEERQAAFMEKFDVNKDGQLDDQEKEAVKAEFAKRHEKCGDRPRGPKGCGCQAPRGPKGPGCGPRPHGPKKDCGMKPAAPAEAPVAPEAVPAAQ